MKIVYFHGFGSSGVNEKSKALQDRFGSDNVWSPDLPLDAHEVIRMVTDYVSGVNEPIVFTGTSLGGFYANYFAQLFNCSCVLVNPAVDPGVSLTKSLGTHTNYSSGLTFELTQSHLDKWTLMSATSKIVVNSDLINLFVALDDEVIAAEKMLAAFPNYHYLKTFETGGHRFLSHWHLVVDYVEQLL